MSRADHIRHLDPVKEEDAQEVPAVQHQQEEVGRCGHGQRGGHQAVSAPGSPRQGHEQAQQQGGILQGGAQRTRREQVQGQEGEVEHPLQQQKSRHAPPAEPLDQNVLLPSTKAVPFSVARMRKKYNPCQQKRTAAPGKRHCGPC